MLRVYNHRRSTFVIGTDDPEEACRELGISPETHEWVSTSYGMYAYRKGEWGAVATEEIPSDAHPGVHFIGITKKSMDS